MNRIISFILFTSLAFQVNVINAQEEMDNATRSLFILDIAKYIEYDDEIQLHSDFKIGVMGRNTDFYWELYESKDNLQKSRQLLLQIKSFLFPSL